MADGQIQHNLDSCWLEGKKELCKQRAQVPHLAAAACGKGGSPREEVSSWHHCYKESRNPIIIRYYAWCIFSEWTCTGGTYNVIKESSTQTPMLHGAMKCHGKATGSNSHGHPSHPLYQHQLLPENYSQWCSQQVHVHVCGAMTGQVRLFCAIPAVRLWWTWLAQDHAKNLSLAHMMHC